MRQPCFLLSRSHLYIFWIAQCKVLHKGTFLTLFPHAVLCFSSLDCSLECINYKITTIMFGNVIYVPLIKKILQRASIKLLCFHLVFLFSFFLSNSSLLYDNFCPECPQVLSWSIDHKDKLNKLIISHRIWANPSCRIDDQLNHSLKCFPFIILN